MEGIRVYLYNPDIERRGGYPVGSRFETLKEWRAAKRRWLDEAIEDGEDVIVLTVEDFELRYNWEMIEKSRILIVNENED